MNPREDEATDRGGSNRKNSTTSTNTRTKTSKTTRLILLLVAILAVLGSLWNETEEAGTNVASAVRTAIAERLQKPGNRQTGTTASPFRVLGREKWIAWNKSSVLFEDWGFQCRKAKFTPANGIRISAPMCVHSERDIVSSSILRYGRWDDCSPVPRMQDASNPRRYHLEVGANIGACVMEVLLRTDAQIIAFEPVPKNLFCLTSTLMGLNETLRDRVTVFPIGLGDKPGEFEIYSAKGNFGNSVVGQEIKDMEWQKFEEAVPISIERADDLLDFSQLEKNNNDNDNDDDEDDTATADMPDIVMKMDTQGFECNVMRGMMETCRRYVRKVFFEADEHFLSATEGCSVAILLDLMKECGMTHFTRSDGAPVNLNGSLPGDLIGEKDQYWKPGHSKAATPPR